MKFNKKLFVILWLAGMTGVFSLLFVDYSVLLANMPPIPEEAELPKEFLPTLVKITSPIQPAILLSIAVLLGIFFAQKVGLSSPAADALVNKTNPFSVAKSQLFPGLAGGLLGATLIMSIAALFWPLLPAEFTAKAPEFEKAMPLITRMLYGGITEELLVRWGFMTLTVFVAWQVIQKGKSAPQARCYIIGMLISSIVFGLGHLPIAFMLSPKITFGLIAYIILGNSVFGIIAGYLYWKKGLEAAIIAHCTAHLIMYTATFLTTSF